MIDTLIQDIGKQGLSVQVFDGDLHVQPRANITPEIRAIIQQHKDALVDFIEIFEERAAIMEFDAPDIHPNREAAQNAAYEDLINTEKGYNNE